MSARVRSQSRRTRRTPGASSSWLARYGSPVSAIVMAALVVGIVVGNGPTLLVVGVVSLASVLVAWGWPSLTDTHMGVLAQVTTAFVGIASALVTALTHNFAQVAPVLGLGIGCAVAITLFFGPTPVDHSHVTRGDAPLPRAESSTSVHHSGALRMTANTICAMAVTSTAACWVALIDSPAWAPLAVPAGIIVAAVVLGDQCGRSFRANSWGAVLVAVLVGVVLTVLASAMGQASTLPVVFGYIRHYLGPNVAAGLLGLVTGIVVACSVIAVDGLLGDHARHGSRLGAAARGCVKFLVSAVPVYAMIRVGAL